jgi:hypothetical protein
VKKLFFLLYFVSGLHVLLCAQQPDSIPVTQKDSVLNPVLPLIINQYNQAIQSILQQNVFLNSKGAPVSMAVKVKKAKPSEAIFYIIAGLILLMALIKFFFARYFTNLFTVFFNTSLRQGQLTDQLLQAKLPSLFFNFFFMLSGGVYIYFLLQHYGLVNQQRLWIIIATCIIGLTLIYGLKYSSLKFTGWITGYKTSTDTYIFIIFLICKILGIILLPFIVIMAFAQPAIAATGTFISLLIIGLLFFLRFLRSYSLLQNQLKVSRLHFLLYLIGVEVIPVLLLYKGVLILLSKNV